MNSKLELNIAFNYGSDKELLTIVNKIVNTSRYEKKDINYNLIQKYKYLSNTPDPDLLIRTGGFQRLSNFLLLNISYTELFFTETLWPDLIKPLDIFCPIETKYNLPSCLSEKFVTCIILKEGFLFILKILPFNFVLKTESLI